MTQRREKDLSVWPMRPLLQQADGAAISDVAGWMRRADEMRKLVMQTLGTRPESQGLRRYWLEQPLVDRDVVRTLVHIEVDENDVMDAWLLEPAASAVVRPRRGAALALHPTVETGKDDTAGVSREYPGRAYGEEMARRGWVVLAPDQVATQKRYAKGLKTYDTARFYERFPAWSSVGKIMADGRAAVDVLTQLPQSAGLPITAIGHSLGAQSSVYVGAADSRVGSVVCNCGIYPFADSQARAHWFRDQWYIYYKDAALKKSVVEGPQPLWDFHELAALIAPRRLWLALAPNDYCGGALEGVFTMTRELHKVWDVLEAHGNLSVLLHNEGHVFETWQRQHAYAWLENERSPEALSALRGYAKCRPC